VKARSYLAYLLFPPLVVVLPLALGFLARVGRADALPIDRIALGAIIGYGLGAIAYISAVAPKANRVSEALATGGDISTAVSDCLQQSELIGAAYWMIWGGIVAMIGSAVYIPSFRGVQFFTEAMLIVAVPAMAWTYWGGKSFLLGKVPLNQKVGYRGRMYSIGIKIGLVFIAFYVVSVGALVLLVASHLAYRLREPNIAIDAVVADVITFGASAAIVTAAIFALATYLLTRDINRPMAQLLSLAGDLAEGRFDTVVHVFADDETGHVAERFAVTQRNLRGLIGKIGNSGIAITDGVRFMNDGTQSLLTGASQQSNIAESSTSALTNVRREAESVLVAVERFAEVTYDSASRASELKASSAEVARQMDDLFQSVEKTSSSTTEIDASARETSRRTTELAGFSSDVLTFVTEMDATVEQIHRTSSSTAQIADEVRQNAIAGRLAVQETVGGIRSAQDSTRRTAGSFDSLQKSLGQIDQILLLIEELTNRTNLLSFNAAIIAAQAGAHDFGFSVIAEEVRQLAERTRGATKEISVIIRGVQPIAREAVQAINEGVVRVDATVDLAQRAAESLEAILSSADRSKEVSQMIIRAIEEQTQATRHLHDVMVRMSENVTEIHRATQGQAEATRLLALESERVRDIALHVKRASDEQTIASGGIAGAMEQIASDIRGIRDRLDHQLKQAEEIAKASQVTLSIAQKNNAIAEQFSTALGTLLRSGTEFATEVSRFKV
jgi:methyl-accepting chemotaxis protein